MEGGRQEGDRRAGTENLPAIVGFGVAAEEWVNSGEKFRNSTRKAQKALADGIRKKISFARLHGPEVGDSRSPTHLAFSFAGLEAESLALVLDRVGLAARGGSGCVTREMRIPPAMRAIGAKPEEARALILFTLGTEMDPEKISMAVDLVKEAVQRLTSALPS
jgi:cysteine desulfurase